MSRPGNWRKLADEDWPKVRQEYESSHVSQRDLALKWQVSESTLMKRAAREKWKQDAALVANLKTHIATRFHLKAEDAIEKAAETAANQVVDELRPWIEEKRKEHIKRAVATVEKGYERLAKLTPDNEPLAPKDEAYVAKALDSYDNSGRRNLGMSELQPFAGALTLNILAGQSLVQVASNA